MAALAAYLQRLAPQLARRVRKGALRAVLHRIDGEIRAQSGMEKLLMALASTKEALYASLQDRAGSRLVAKALTVKVLNLCLAKCHYLARSSTLLSRPFGLIVDPSDACNLACPGCVHSRHAQKCGLFDWDAVMLPEHRFAALLARYGAAAIHVAFCNYGEPLLNPRTPQLIRMAKRYLMRTTISTNLSMGRLDAEACVASGLDFMVVSIDGATQAVYERFRRKGNLELALGNLRKFTEARRKLGKRTPVIAWHYLAFEHNAHEIPAAMEMARDFGVNQFSVLTPFDVTWDDPAVRPAAVEPFTAKFDEDSPGALGENWNPFPADLAGPEIQRAFETWPGGECRVAAEAAAAPGHTCSWLYKSISMDAGGRIFPCCGAPRPDIDFVFGYLDRAGAADPFNSEKYRLSRLRFADPEAYARERDARRLAREPQCVNCGWDTGPVDTDSAEIRSYFQTAEGGVFDRAGIAILADW